MMSSGGKRAVCSLLTLQLSLVCCSTGPEITLPAGRVKGVVQETINGREIHSFLGIPYAKPPVGQLRFKEPIPFGKWPGTLNATSPPNKCLQSNKRGVGNEDCLYLNVYTHKVPNEREVKNLDVIFLIYGGSFQEGFSHRHGPEYLLDEVDVVLVTMNYRLGILGFLSLQDDVLPGNMGLKDQLLALKWVNANIAAFGGDPNKVTLIGCSAGGASVHFHVLSSQSRGLFHKAVALSGTALNPWAVDRHPRAKVLRISQALGCPTDDSKAIVECLREKPAELVTRQAELFVEYLVYDFMAVIPVVEKSTETAFIDRWPEDIIKSGQANDVPFLVTYTDDEALFASAEIFMNSSAVEELNANWDNLLPIILCYRVREADKHEVAKLIKDFYLEGKTILETPERFTQLLNERGLSIGIRETAKLHAKYYKSPVYSYIFTHTGGERISDMYNHSEIYKGGAVHMDDLLYIFKTEVVILKRTGDPTEEKMSKTMIEILMKFVKEDPVTGWQTVQSGLPHFTYLEISGPDQSKNVFKTLKDDSAERFWNSLPLEENRNIYKLNKSMKTEL